ncbi:unnamed protein product, partial [Staurois parvus]
KTHTHLSLGPAVCPPQPVLPAVFSPWAPASSVCGHPAVTACGFTAGYPLQMQSSAALPEWSCNLLGTVTCPKRLREGGREDTFYFQSPRRSQRKWERVPVKFGLPAPQRCQSLMGSGGQRLKAELPLLGGAPL